MTAHTVFEGFSTNTKKTGLQSLAKYELSLPMAMSGTPTKRSGLMRDYRTGGTPWTVLIGPDGRVSWNGFRLTPEQAIARIRELLPDGKVTGEGSPNPSEKESTNRDKGKPEEDR